MAKDDVGALSATMEQQAKLPLYGASETQLQELKDAQQQALQALEARYAQPNWFKVAAGFLKPQLGGFGASLGSASEALGENIEQQRAQQLPISQMRAQLAQTNFLMSQNKTVSEMLAERKAKNQPITPEFVREVTARFPESSIAKSLSAEIATQQKQQELTANQQRLMMDSIVMKQAKGMSLSAPEKAFLENLPAQLSNLKTAEPLLEEGKPMAKPSATPEQISRAQGDVEALQREISRLKPGDPRLMILNAELQKAQEAASVLPSEVGKTAESKPSKLYPESFPVPNLADKPDWERTARGEAWKANANAEEKRNSGFVDQYSLLAEPTIFETLDSHYNTAISLIENNPKLAKKVFNTLRGSGEIQNQIMTALQQGAGLNLGNVTANINLPVQAFQKAGFNPEEQKYADRLVHSMLILGNSDLAMRGITPEKGQKAYFENLVTKANLDQNAETALNILHKNKVAFDMNKKLYDTLVDERSSRVNPESLTPYTDIMRNSEQIKRIKEDANKRLEKYKSDYQAMLDAQSKARKSP